MAQTLPILALHALEDSASNLSFPPTVFEQGMRHLARNGFRTLTVSQFAALLKSNTPWPAKSFVLTFDDGYQCFYERAFPLLSELGFSATVFINTGPVCGPNLPDMLGRLRLAWSQIREIHSHGIEIGAHTITHPNLTMLPPGKIQEELAGNKVILEDFLGEEVKAFAYPFGFANSQARTIAARYFDSGCTGQLGLATIASDPFILPRLEMHYFRSHGSFQMLTSPLLAPYLAFRRLPRRVRQSIRSAFHADSGGWPS